MKSKIIALVLAVVLALGFLSQKPFVSYKSELPAEYKQAVESHTKGVYSSRLPLVPVYVSVGECTEKAVHYTIYYFPFGTVEMSYSSIDGYNIEKQLSRI